MTVTQDWLRCVTPRPEAAVRLICLPHAGGSASFYAGWGARLPQVEVHAVAYPGRAHRVDDPLAEDLIEMAREIASAIAPLADRPLALFGHSMGAAVALETARALEAAGVPVVHLFASGSRNGPLPAFLPPPSEDPAELVQELVRLGGTDPELAEDPDFQELVLPYTLGDGKLFHGYRMSSEPLLRCPVTCIVGDEDADSDIRPWAETAPAGFVERIVAGDHFYLSESPPDEIIAATLAGQGEGTGRMSHTTSHADVTEADAVRERDSHYVWHPWSRNEVERDRLMIVRGEGTRVWDAAGREYIDASSLNSTVGYGNEEVIAAATEQLRTLHGVDMSATNHPVAGRLAEAVAGYLPEGLSRTLLLNSGSEAIEAALMIASCYRRITGDPRNRVITFALGYHGSTVLSRGLSGLVPTGHPFHQPIEVTRVTLPVPAELRTPGAAKALAAAFSEALAGDGDGDAPLAVVIEPFLNVGGGIVLPPGFLTELRGLCDRSGALLILDEIFTGYGRTGRMFAFQHEDAAPDILVSSKGLGGGYLPISAVTARQDIYAAFADDEIIGGLRYGHTTAGHATSSAVALATLGVMERQGLVKNADDRGRELLKLIEPLRSLPGVVDTRGLGLVGVVEMTDMAAAAALVVSCQETGLMVRQQAGSVLLCPPLTITSAEVEEIAARLTTATRSLASELSV